MAAPGEMTASLTLRLRDDLSAGIREIREQFASLKGSLDGLTGVLAEVRDALSGLKAPKAMMEGFQTSLRQAADVSYAIGRIGIESVDVGKQLATALTAPLVEVNNDVKAVVDTMKNVGTAAAASGKEIAEVAAAAKEATRVAVLPGARHAGKAESGPKDTNSVMDWMTALIEGALGLSAIRNYSDYMQPLGHAAITEKLSGPAAIKEMNRIAASLQRLAISTAQSSMELAQAYLFLETTPMKLQKGLIDAMMPVMAEAATAYNVPVPEMQQAVYALSDVMQVPGADMLKAFGELAYAAKAAHYNMAAFSAGLPELGAAMRLYGATGLQAVTALAAGMEAVVQFTRDMGTATTGMSELLHYLSSPMAGRMFDRTKRSWKMLPAFERTLLEKYHVPALNVAAFIKEARAQGKDPLNAVVDWLHGFFRHIKPADVSDISFVMGALFHNKEAGEAITAMLLNYGQFKALQKQLGSVSKGTVNTDFATAMQFPEVQVKLFQEEFAQLERAIGKDLLPLLGGVNVALKDLLSGLKGLDKIAPGLSTVLVQAVAIGMAFKTLAGVFRMGSGRIGKILGVGADAAEATVAASWVAETAGWAAAAGAYGLLSPLVAVPAMTGAAIATFSRINAAAAKEAAKIWSDHAKATLNVTVETNEIGLPVAHDANGLPLLLHFSSPQVSGSLPGSGKLGLVLGRK